MSRTPYSPLVENETAPEPWKSGRCGADVPGLIAVRERDLVTWFATISE